MRRFHVVSLELLGLQGFRRSDELVLHLEIQQDLRVTYRSPFVWAASSYARDLQVVGPRFLHLVGGMAMDTVRLMIGNMKVV